VAPPVQGNFPAKSLEQKAVTPPLPPTSLSDGSLTEEPIEYLGHYQWRFTDTPVYWLNTEEYYLTLALNLNRLTSPPAFSSSHPYSPPPPNYHRNPLLPPPDPLTSRPTPNPTPTMATKSSFKVDKPSSFDGTKSKYDAWRVNVSYYSSLMRKTSTQISRSHLHLVLYEGRAGRKVEDMLCHW